MKALLKEPIAEMRRIAGLTQAGLAELVGSSRVYIGKFEIGAEKMSRAMAERISTQTGISPDWLLGDDLDNPTTIYGDPFTEQSFNLHRSVLSQTEEQQTQQLQEANDELLKVINDAKKDYSKAKRKGMLARIFKQTAFGLWHAISHDMRRHNYAPVNKLRRAVNEANSQFFSQSGESAESSDSSSQKSKPKKPSKSKRPSPKKKRKA